MVAHILPPDVADKLQHCFQALTSAMQSKTMPRLTSQEECVFKMIEEITVEFLGHVHFIQKSSSTVRVRSSIDVRRTIGLRLK